MENFRFQGESITPENAQATEHIQKQQRNIITKILLNGDNTQLLKEQDNKIRSFVYFLLFGLHAFNFVIIQDLISNKGENTTFQQAIQQFHRQIFFYWSALIGSVLLKILLVVSVLMEIILKKEIVIVSWLNKKCVNNFTILKQLDLLISGIMVLVCWQENLAQLIISGAITIFHAVYMQQYINRKDFQYAASSTQIILVRIYLLLSYLANTFFFFNFNSSTFLACYSFFGFALIITWYIIQGHTLYIHTFSRTAFHIVISFFLTVYLVFIQCWINSKQLIDTSQMFKFFLVFSAMLFIDGSFLEKKELSNGLKNSNPKTTDLELLRLYQQSLSNKDSQSLLTGILHQSFDTNEDISIDYYNGEIYDSYLKESVAQEEVYMQKESLLRIYIRQIYEKSLESKKDVETIISYCLFLVNQCNSIYNTMKYIQNAKMSVLNIVQTVRVAKMEIFLKEQQDDLSKQLYNGKLAIEHIRDAQECFSQIEAKIYLYIEGNLNVWSCLQLQEVEMGELRKSLMREMKIIVEINSLWKDISMFFKINKAWRLIYLNYMIFIQNEKVKQKQCDLFTHDVEQQSIFNRQLIYFEESSKENRLYDSKIMFNQNSCCFIAAYQLGQLFIKDVNSRFTRILGYTKEEIKGAPFSVILPPRIVEEHNQKFKDWVNSGLLSNETSYHHRFTSFVTKNNEQIPALKYYKAYYHIDRGLEFVCLLKQNIKSKIGERQQQCSVMNYMKQSSKSNNIRSPTLQHQFQEKRETDITLRKNIFLKEETLQPNSTLSTINYFKLAARIFTAAMIIGIIILGGINNILGANSANYGSQFITFMNMYRYPIILDINYMKLFLKIGNTTKTNATIISNTALFLQNSNKAITRKTLFDLALNPPDIYYPKDRQNFTNKANLSHIDLYQQMVSAISTLSYTTINRTSNQFRVLNAYTKPSYDDMMNKTKKALKETFEVLFSKTINQQIGFMVSQSILFVLFVVIILKLIQTFVLKTRNIVAVLLDFDSKDVSEAYQYWKKINMMFNQLFKQTNYQKEYIRKISTKHQKLCQKQTNKTLIMNKQSKRMKEDTQRMKFITKLKVLLLISMLSILLCVISFQLSLVTTLNNLQAFEQDGFFFVKYFPIGPIISKGCIEKYYSDMYPKEIKFNPKIYEDSLSTMSLFGYNNDYVSDKTDQTSLYNTKRYNYFFGSPCEFNPSIILKSGTPIEKCLNICNDTYKQGMSSYLRYAARLGDICINNKTYLTSAQVDQFNLGGVLLSIFIMDAMATWTTEFAQRVTNMQDQSFRNSIIMIIVIMVIHFLVKEFRLIGFIESEYQLVKQIYLHFVPEFILIKEKVIRQKLIIQGIINN